jgi:hypothetical protein
MLQRF